MTDGSASAPTRQATRSGPAGGGPGVADRTATGRAPGGPSTGKTPTRAWATQPFTRLARTHTLSITGDTLFTAAMAGTVFFSVADFDAARGRVALLLVLTIAPFAVAAPLLGPLFDRVRGGRRWMVVGLAVARAILSLLIIRHRDSWLFFVEALLFLVLSKGYLIARGALVPTTVRNDAELVKANSRLALLSGVTAALAAGPAVLLLWLGGPSWVLVVAAILFAACAVAALQLPAVKVAAQPPDAVEIAELRSTGILVAASSMAAIRLVVGFLVFQVGFYAKDNNQGLLIVAAAVGAQIGFLGGSMAAPLLRRRFSEERILAVVLSFTVAAGLVATLIGLLADGSAITLGLAATLLSAAVAATSNVGKQAFDAIVQRDAPDANRGRSFARFETRFQLVWVLGALIPTAEVLPLEVSFVVVSCVAAFALLSYLVGRRRAAAGVDYRLVRVNVPTDRLRSSSSSAARATLGYFGWSWPNGGARPGPLPSDPVPPAAGRAGPTPAGGSGHARPGPHADSGTGTRPDLPELPDVPPRPRTPADAGRLGLHDDPRRYPALPDPTGEGATIFGHGVAPHAAASRQLDPRKVLDLEVPLDEVSGAGRYLGFLDDTLSDAGGPGVGGPGVGGPDGEGPDGGPGAGGDGTGGGGTGSGGRQGRRDRRRNRSEARAQARSARAADRRQRRSGKGPPPGSEPLPGMGD